MERGFSYFMMQQPWRGRLHSAPLTRGACTDVVDCGFRQVSLAVCKVFTFTFASRPCGVHAPLIQSSPPRLLTEGNFKLFAMGALFV